MPNQLDQSVVNLAKAIREHETGNRQIQGSSGEMASRYQYLPSTWRSTAAKYLGNPNAKLTLENENKATYLKIKDWKDQGYNVGQIASMWNSGKPEWEGNVGVNSFGVKYNVPAYVESVNAKYQALKAQTQPRSALGETVQPVEEKKGFFGRVGKSIKERGSEILDTFKKTARGEISPAETGVRVVGDVIGGTFDVIGEAIVSGVKAVTPDEVEESFKKKGLEFLETSVGKLGMNAVRNGVEEWEEFKVNFPRASENIEGVINIASILPVERATTGVLRAGKGLSTEAKMVAKKGLGLAEDTGKVVGKASTAITEKIPEVTKYGVGQATGLKPTTITEVLRNPKMFTKELINSIDRESVAKTVKGKIDERIKALSSTGKGYNLIRESDEVVNITTNPFKTVMDKFNIGFADGKITRSKSTKIPLREGDVKALQEFGELFGTESKLTADEFLNARAMLSDMAKFDATKSTASSEISRALRKEYDALGKDQLTGLKILDTTYSAEKTILDRIKKDYFTKGEFKDGAVNKIANLGGVGKQKVMDRLKTIVPNIEEQINVLKAIEDINYAKGIKVGTYTRSIALGGGIATGNIPLVLASIVASPDVAVQLLRKYATSNFINKGLLNATITSLKSGKKLVGDQLRLFTNFLKSKAETVKKWLEEIKKNQKGFARIPGTFGNSRDSAMEALNKFIKHPNALPSEKKVAEELIKQIEKGTEDMDVVFDFLQQNTDFKLIKPKTDLDKK